MQLRNSTIDKLHTLTKTELDFIVFLARRQDESGRVTGVHVRTVCEDKKIMCKQSFYNVLGSLCKKGFICYTRTSNYDYDIMIIGNRKWKPGDTDGYVNLNRQIFRKKEFRSMKSKEKYMLFDLLRLTGQNQGVYEKNFERFYKHYGELLKVSVRVIRNYLHTLKNFFTIYRKGTNRVVRYNDQTFRKENTTEVGKLRKHLAEVYLRRAGATGDQSTSTDIIEDLLAEFDEKVESSGHDPAKTFTDAIHQILSEKKELTAAYMNKLIHQRIETTVECIEAEDKSIGGFNINALKAHIASNGAV
ncbi:MAG: hypothetical protein ACK5MN_00505 [Lachnospiraceae bacterium]